MKNWMWAAIAALGSSAATIGGVVLGRLTSKKRQEKEIKGDVAAMFATVLESMSDAERERFLYGQTVEDRTEGSVDSDRIVEMPS